jgi:hypothetical protein
MGVNTAHTAYLFECHLEFSIGFRHYNLLGN